MRLVSVHLTVYVLSEMPPRRAQARDPVVPEGYVRAEDVQRMIDEALAERDRRQVQQDPPPAQAQPQVEVQLDEPDLERYSRCLAQFQKMRPPSFAGETDPDVAETWVMGLEKIFDAIRCPKEY